MAQPVVFTIKTDDKNDFDMIECRIKAAFASPQKPAKELAQEISKIENELQDAGKAVQKSPSAIKMKANDARCESNKLDERIKSLSASITRNNSIVAAGTDEEKKGYAEQNKAIRVEQDLLRARKSTFDIVSELPSNPKPLAYRRLSSTTGD